ncbi:DDE-type integrase/transposase/recombinase [Sphingomonadaceae bacterium OTU29MARTA1]|nr:DDE-type integrase/transposase/recombinase [Sphingomonadaceae bacterium OTU29MARTA1]
MVLQLWGGPGCTVNRTASGYQDQTRLSGHHGRSNDLELFGSLGLAAIRYPILWERVAPDPQKEADWLWTDSRLSTLRELNIRPIAGLVHHGSGPPHTNLLADDFATGLGRYADQVVRRYPWIEDWTPVNEPLTTARFSALYGHWYPHARDESSFWRALLNQTDGTRAAMRAVRRINPAARLVQTDDLGRTYATLSLGEQATDGLRSCCAAMKDLGNADKHEVGRWANNWVENSHLPFQRRERAMQRFRRMKTLRKFASIHANVHNHFSSERHLVDQQTYKNAAHPPWPSGRSWRGRPTHSKPEVHRLEGGSR